MKRTYWKLASYIQTPGNRPESQDFARDNLGEFPTFEAARSEWEAKREEYQQALRQHIGRREVHIAGIHVEKYSVG